MNITLQATGYSPREIEALRTIKAVQMVEGDKRGVSVTFHQTKSGWYVEVQYITSWGIERPFCHVAFCHDAETASAWVRGLARSVLPPGAGYPATPAFDTRQAKLKGMMETLTLVALSEVLAQV